MPAELFGLLAHVAEEAGDAVHLIERVGEQPDAKVLRPAAGGCR